MTGHITVVKPNVRERLLETGLRILHERGFNATGVQDITEAAGVPKGSFYNHFESKEALGIEVLERYWQVGLNSLKILEDTDVAPVSRLKAYFHKLNLRARKLDYRYGC